MVSSSLYFSSGCCLSSAFSLCCRRIRLPGWQASLCSASFYSRPQHSCGGCEQTRCANKRQRWDHERLSIKLERDKPARELSLWPGLRSEHAELRQDMIRPVRDYFWSA